MSVSQPVADFDKKSTFLQCAICILAAASLVGAASAQVPVSITVSTLNNHVTDYTNVRLPHGVTATEGLGGFQVDMTAISGTSVNLAPHATFCTELGENISTGSYTNFQVVPLQYASAGTAGEPGTPSSSIPAGGIGLQSAAEMRYLFDTYYVAENLNSWTTVQSQAFQLAVWEIGHDPQNLTITSSGGGVFFVPTQSGQGSAARNQAITLAQSMLTAVDTANVSLSYQSTKVDVWSLANDGSPGVQDILFATLKASSDGQAVIPHLPVPIPEPTTAGLAAAGLLALIRRKRQAA
jgi:hypothetical protein